LISRQKIFAFSVQTVRRSAWKTAAAFACFAVLLLICSFYFKLPDWPIRVLYDLSDLKAYFDASNWVRGYGVLYIDLQSDYPFLANVIFGLVRCIAIPLSGIMNEFNAFCCAWSSLSGLVLVLAVKRIMAVQRTKLFFWIIFAPSFIYFVMFRYDIYPAVCCLFSLLAIKENKIEKSAIWLGFSIALKVYAVVLIPSLIIFLYSRTPVRRIFKVLCLVFLPFIISNLIILAWGGMDALLNPYLYQAGRIYNRESIYDSFFYLLLLAGVSGNLITIVSEWISGHHIPTLLQIISCTMIPLLIRPKDWEELLQMWILLILCFISFSIFNSPQFLIWVAVPACLLPASRPLTGVIVFAWINYLYFPVGFDLAWNWDIRFVYIFIIAVWAVTILRFYIMAELLLKLLQRKMMRHGNIS
jgi:hypothetical protein